MRRGLVLPATLAAACLIHAPSAAAGQPAQARNSAAATVLSPKEQNVLTGGELFHEAHEAIRRRDYSRAADKLRRLISLEFPDEPDARELMAGAHASLAEVLMEQRQLPAASDVARRGLDLTGTDNRPTALRADLYDLLRRISSESGEAARAREYSDKAQHCQQIAGSSR